MKEEEERQRKRRREEEEERYFFSLHCRHFIVQRGKGGGGGTKVGRVVNFFALHTREKVIRAELEELKDKLKTKEQEEQILRQQVERMSELEKQLLNTSQQKEEEKKKQEASFHEQMALLRNEFDAEKQKLEEVKKLSVCYHLSFFIFIYSFLFAN